MVRNKMQLEDIGFYTLSNERALNSSHTSPLKRCEIILTDKCNFKCKYCMPLSPEIRGTLYFNNVRKLINEGIRGNLENIRFSGGEPTLYKGLEDLVSLCRPSMKHIAVSTNGSNNIEYYEKLHSLGVNDFSISLDSACCSISESMASVKSGTWQKVVDNIKEISKFCYVTVGMVFTEENIATAVESVMFAHNLGVADIRVISAVQYNKSLDNLKDIPQYVLDAHPILKYRINHYLSGRNIRGLEATDSNRCKIVLDDMLLAGSYHYPCVIYMRQNGDPIGTTVNKSVEEIRLERKEWFENTNTHEDKICSRTCLDVCVDFNNVARGVHET